MNLTPEQIVNIISECKGHVKSLIINKTGIEVIFTESHKPVELAPSTHNQGYPEIPIPEEKNLVKDLDLGITAEEMEDQRLVEELHITDPGAYEDLVMLKELVDVEEN